MQCPRHCWTWKRRRLYASRTATTGDAARGLLHDGADGSVVRSTLSFVDTSYELRRCHWEILASTRPLASLRTFAVPHEMSLTLARRARRRTVWYLTEMRCAVEGGGEPKNGCAKRIAGVKLRCTIVYRTKKLRRRISTFETDAKPTGSREDGWSDGVARRRLWVRSSVFDNRRAPYTSELAVLDSVWIWDASRRGLKRE
ncbi:hypothetical protein C2E23DRAFT_421513 [Lenzites betulinus]|nr:hypothetical protein C2E23DRAFT_421513 [Lenzites betulinus]